MIYFKGETIPIFAKGDNEHNLDVNTFVISIYNPLFIDSAIDIKKADCSLVEPNVYLYEISNSITKQMKEGKYTIEVLLGENKTLIGKYNDAFKIENSYSKKHVL